MQRRESSSAEATYIFVRGETFEKSRAHFFHHCISPAYAAKHQEANSRYSPRSPMVSEYADVIETRYRSCPYVQLSCDEQIYVLFRAKHRVQRRLWCREKGSPKSRRTWCALAAWKNTTWFLFASGVRTVHVLLIAILAVSINLGAGAACAWLSHRLSISLHRTFLDISCKSYFNNLQKSSGIFSRVQRVLHLKYEEALVL